MTEGIKKNWFAIFGVLIMCVGIMFANYGTAVCLSGEMTAMEASQYYVLVAALGTLGMMLVLPMVGKITGILGQRNIIILGITVQVIGRLGMMLFTSWVPYAASYFLQSIGGGLYVAAAFVMMAISVNSSERAKFFAYIAAANAVGAIFGPIIVSTMCSVGGILGDLAYISYLPFVLIGFILMFSACPTARAPRTEDNFDYAGIVTMVIGVAGVVFWLNLGGKMFSWISLPSAIILIVTIVFLTIMIRRELSIDNPSVPIRMFKNDRLRYAFIGGIANSAYTTCSAAYGIMWIMSNYSQFPAATFFNGTATMVEQIVVFVLGIVLGAYFSKKFILKFRKFGILAMVAAMIATGILFCLKFTGTLANGDIIAVGSIPIGMLMIYLATAIGGFSNVVAQSTFNAFWQTNTPKEDLTDGTALYNFGATGGSCLFGAVVGVIIGTSGDYTRAFATAFVFALIGLICAIRGFKFTEEEIEIARME